MNLDIDLELLREFERYLDPRHPEKSKIPAKILGYGEISTVFEIGEEGQRDFAYKRMPIFRSEEELRDYEKAYNEYVRLLSEEVGLNLPPHGYASIITDQGRMVFFLAQKKLNPDSIGNRAIHLLPHEDILRLVRKVLQELKKVWDFNRKSGTIDLGIDGQISNWSIVGFDSGSRRLPQDLELIYFDTNTPLFRVNGVEQLNAELFLRSAPSFLVWLLRMLFLEDVLNRYHDFHLVAIDLIGNFYKEQLPELIPELIDVANDFFADEARELEIKPISFKEVKSYYREDALIWSTYLSMRKLDRLLRTKILKRDYPYILPGKIKRR